MQKAHDAFRSLNLRDALVVTVWLGAGQLGSIISYEIVQSIDSLSDSQNKTLMVVMKTFRHQANDK